MDTPQDPSTPAPPRRLLRRFIAAGLLGASSLALAWPATAQLIATQGGWLQVGGDASLTGAAQAPSPPYRVAWTTPVALGGPLHQFGVSEPVTDGTTLVTVGPSEVLGFDLTTGNQAWTVDRDLGPSVPAAIASVGGRQVVVYTEGFGDHPPTASLTPSASPSPSPPPSPGTSAAGGPFDSHLAAFDLKTREPLYKPIQLNKVSRTGVTVADGTAFVGDNAGTVYAVDLATGKVSWTALTGGFLTTPLAVANGLLIASVQGDRDSHPAVVALHTTDGAKEWEYEGDGSAFLTTAATAGPDAVYVGLSDATVRSINLSDGTEVWRSRLNSPVNFASGVALSGSSLFAADLFGELYRMDAATGSRVWDFALNQPVFRSPPAVVDDNHVLVATADGGLNAVAIDSGHLVWQSDTSGQVLRSLALTPNLVVGVHGGTAPGLVAFGSDPSGALIDVVSPTTLNVGAFVGNFLIGTVPITLLLILAGQRLSRRMGPAFVVVDDDGEPLDDDAAGQVQDGDEDA